MSAALIEKTVEDWLRPKAARTQRAYRGDLALWFVYCEQAGVDPLRAVRADADKWRAYLEEQGYADASVARRMAAAGSFYLFALDDGVAERNPFARAQRPKVDPDFSPTVYLSGEEAARFLQAAELRARFERPGRMAYLTAMRNLAMAATSLILGLRTDEVATLTLGDYTEVAEVMRLTVCGKGNKRVRRDVPPRLAEYIDRYLAERVEQLGRVCASDPLFATFNGRVVDSKTRYAMVRMIALDARLANAMTISPHSLRHTYATMATENGASTRDLQRSMAHSSERTTARYRHDVLDDPSMLVAAALVR